MTTTRTAPLLAALFLSATTGAQAIPVLGLELETFAALGGAAVTSTGTTQLVGSLGASANASLTGITGFLGTLANDGPGTATGTVHQGDAFATLAGIQLGTAKNNLALMGSGTLLGADLVGMTLTPGVYTVPAGSSNLSGTVTLDGGGNANAFWVFQLPSSLITSTGSAVNVINTGAGAGVFWNVGSSATLGTGTIFEGNILATASISLGTGASVACGRALAQSGAVTMISNSINAGDCLGTGEEGSLGLSGGLTLAEGSGTGGTGGGTGGTGGTGGGTIGTIPTPLPFLPVVTPIPEPQAYLMMMVGLGIVGWIAQRRRRPCDSKCIVGSVSW